MAAKTNKIEIFINDKKVSVVKDSFLMKAVQEAGFILPTLCHLPRSASPVLRVGPPEHVLRQGHPRPRLALRLERPGLALRTRLCGPVARRALAGPGARPRLSPADLPGRRARSRLAAGVDRPGARGRPGRAAALSHAHDEPGPGVGEEAPTRERALGEERRSHPGRILAFSTASPERSTSFPPRAPSDRRDRDGYPKSGVGGHSRRRSVLSRELIRAPPRRTRRRRG